LKAFDISLSGVVLHIPDQKRSVKVIKHQLKITVHQIRLLIDKQSIGDYLN
jgi:hypothetical protein